MVNPLMYHPFIRNTESIRDIRCEIQRLGGTYIGEVTITATNEDSTIAFTNTQSYGLHDQPPKSRFCKEHEWPYTHRWSHWHLIWQPFYSFFASKKKSLLMRKKSYLATNFSTCSRTATNIQPIQPSPETEVQHAGPPLPESGLPDGWSMEQWVHYGQQYLDRLGNHP